jgi:endonuclease YncB( thermonuclease family)
VNRIAKLWIVALTLVANAAFARTGWEVLENCRLLPNHANDGDSFHVTHKNHEYIFRLYYVDAPETDDSFPERVAEQAAYFGISKEHTLNVGHSAAGFTESQLAGRFTVTTRWEDARGRSKLPRYYAFVTVNDKDLAELLVQNGLARVFGEKAETPTGKPPRAVEEKLRRLEREAKASHRGAWGNGSTGAPAATTAYRLFIPSGERHNSNCPFFNAPQTRPCAPTEGKPCHVCGG